MLAIHGADKKVSYCLADISGHFLDGLMGYVVGDFNEDGLLDIGGFEPRMYQMMIFYNSLPDPVSDSLCTDILNEDDEELKQQTQLDGIFSMKYWDRFGVMS
jgi:hypothetical protein